MYGHLPHQGADATTPLQSKSPAGGTATMTAPAEHVDNQGVDTVMTGASSRRSLWQSLRQTVAEMNYASRRIVEVQTPWIASRNSAGQS
jgi:hypothetical protein